MKSAPTVIVFFCWIFIYCILQIAYQKKQIHIKLYNITNCQHIECNVEEKFDCLYVR